MSIFLAKVLSLFVFPLGAAILIGVAGLAMIVAGWRRVGLVMIGCVLAGLWIGATPIVANWLNSRLESQIPPIGMEKIPQSDAVILLGGTPVRRIMRALELYRSSKAPVIIITGGNPPGYRAIVPEAQRVAEILVELGAPRSALILEPRSRNTRENAVNTAAIFKTHGWQHGLLVTEAVSMPRALATFQKLGLNVTPVATNFPSGSPEVHSLLDFLPDVEALAWTTIAVKEMVGFCIYRVRGWA